MARSRFTGTSDWAIATASCGDAPVLVVSPAERCLSRIGHDDPLTAFYTTARTPDWQGRRRMAAMLVVACTSASIMLSGLAAFQRL